MPIFEYQDDNEDYSEVNSEDYSENDSEEEDYDSDIEFDPEEESKSRFNIVLCEPYNDRYHGVDNNSVVKYHYLINCRLKKLDIYYINSIIEVHSNYNLNNRIQMPRLKIEIAECIELETNERIAIIKTFWIRLIQRTWKNILKQRNIIIKKRCNPNSLRWREINGKWPKECNHFPGLKGMLKF